MQLAALSDKCVLITGAAKRIGAVISRTLHAAGATVIIHFHQSKLEAEKLANELNQIRTNSAYLLQCSLVEVELFPELLAQIVQRTGYLDALINNASSFYPTEFGKISTTDWDDLIGSNFRGPLFMSQAAAPYLKERQGCIVNITDIHGERPLANYSLYCAAKGGLLTLTKALAIELAPKVRVNAISPGAILWPEDKFSDEERENIINHTLLARLGSAEEIANCVKFLVSEASYITGQVINVDGGRTAHL